MTQIQGWPQRSEARRRADRGRSGRDALVFGWPDEEVPTRMKQQIPRTPVRSWGGTPGAQIGAVWVPRRTVSVTWNSLCWSPQLRIFAAVSTSDTMTSADGYTWIARSTGMNSTSVCWSPELGLFCATSVSTGARIRTSPDGATWTAQTTPADNIWESVCWSPELGLFCAVSSTGTGNRVMTSPDGVTWTSQTSAVDNPWRSVCWSKELGLFCAIADSGTGNRVMTSPDGVTWTALVNTQGGNAVCWSPALRRFCAVGSSGAIISADGINWTAFFARGASSAVAFGGRNVCWCPEIAQFCAVTVTNGVIAMSRDGRGWSSIIGATSNNYMGVCWSPERRMLVVVSNTGTGNRIITSAA